MITSSTGVYRKKGIYNAVHDYTLLPHGKTIINAVSVIAVVFCPLSKSTSPSCKCSLLSGSKMEITLLTF